MDFFERQEVAKRNSGRLVLLFAVAVVATVAAVHVLVAATIGGGNFLDPRIMLLSGGSVLVVVLLGTLVKMAQMGHGGAAVAAALGGHQIDPSTRDPEERRVLNVVEEMAIASGLPVPPVYIMEEDAINAFAAGNTPRDAVIGVTRGCIRALSRDELQGVMAHEFSHVFHQDMRLNMRLVGWLGGIFAISMIGRVMLRAMPRRRSCRETDGPRTLMAALGLGLFVIGIVGYFFGRVIQSAVSRQREYLADASAVQYTRNPDGIAGALEKIARGAGSRLEAPAAAEFSHFLFADGVASLFATHPPIEERIRRIRSLPAIAADAAAPARARAAAAVPPAPAAVSGFSATASVPPVVPAAAIAESRATMGSPTPSSVSRASAILASLPAPMLEAAHSPCSARAVVCAMLLSAEPAERRRQLATIAREDRALATEVETLARHGTPSPATRLPLLEVCAASLAQLSPAQYAAFRVTLAQLIAADGEVDRVEWTVRILLRQAVEGRGAAPAPGGRATADDLGLVVSVLAWSGARDEAGALRAWAAARAAEPSLGPRPCAPARCTLDALDSSLRGFAGSSMAMRRRLVDAAVACVGADGTTTVEEAELLRAIGASIGAPMPPMVAVAA
jgi:Zn-dependent protease with chaperone function